ncbi:MAG: hypothetical protein RIS70_2616 [Planctomycetota bacterium]
MFASDSKRFPSMLRTALVAVLAMQVILAANGQVQNQVAAKEKETKPDAPGLFECRYATEPPMIDGKADEAIWQSAQVISSFRLPWLGEKARDAKTATRARLLWDNEYLYFFGDMDDADLYADVEEHDGVTWDNDVFELFFKPSDDKSGYYEFQVSAANTVFDMFLPRRGAGGTRRFAKADAFHLESKVALRGTLNQWKDKDQGWSVEGRIPWSDFLRTGGRPAIDETWKFVLCRYDYSVDFEGPELSWCAPTSSQPYPNFHQYEDYASLRFVGPPKKNAQRGIPERLPLTTSRVVGSPEPPLPYRTSPKFDAPPLVFPIAASLIPGHEQWLAIVQPAPYAPSQLVRMQNAKAVKENEKLLEIPDTTAYSIAFHPKFKENGYVYIGCNGPGSPGSKGKTTKVIRYTIDPKTAAFAADSAQIVIEWESDGHNGGAIAFGHDGMMYVTSGDGTSDSDTNLTGQNMSLLLAKVLRIDVDHPDKDRKYSVPKDNPFFGQEGVRPETWCYGLRNPWRMTVDAKTGDLWVGNNGQDLWEQAYRIERGANYGWSVMEGSHPFYLDRKLGPTPAVAPTVEHPHSEARSLTGGVVYHGKRFPELAGAYIYGDHSTGKVWGVRHDGKKILWHRELVDTPFHITGFTEDSDGEVLILDHAAKGNMHRLEPNPVESDAASKFPRLLSQTGLFQSVPDHVLAPGMIPYSVNSPLWSDGAHKERAFGIPEGVIDQVALDVSQPRGWTFPDETVIVKSFALEMRAGDPKSKRWIETRIMVRQQGEWDGYSYRWNDEQTEAVLVDREGLDAQYTIQVPRTQEHPQGVKSQAWHYPSRTECMVCHSRAANFVLGLSTAQMNRDHDYGKVRDNQLKVLEHLGLLRVNWQADVTTAIREDLAKQGLKEAEIAEHLVGVTATRDQRGAPSTTLLAVAPDRYPRLANPYDKSQDLDRRARSYLYANCAQCHVSAGGGNAQLELDYTVPLEKTKLLEPPLHHRFGIEQARVVAPGDPERSVLLRRVSQRGPGQMPQLATAVVDAAAVAMLEEWIRSLKSSEPGASR